MRVPLSSSSSSSSSSIVIALVTMCSTVIDYLLEYLEISQVASVESKCISNSVVLPCASSTPPDKIKIYGSTSDDCIERNGANPP